VGFMVWTELNETFLRIYCSFALSRIAWLRIFCLYIGSMFKTVVEIERIGLFNQISFYRLNYLLSTELLLLVIVYERINSPSAYFDPKTSRRGRSDAGVALN
jgi:hypothetical protein